MTLRAENVCPKCCVAGARFAQGLRAEPAAGVCISRSLYAIAHRMCSHMTVAPRCRRVTQDRICSARPMLRLRWWCGWLTAGWAQRGGWRRSVRVRPRLPPAVEREVEPCSSLHLLYAPAGMGRRPLPPCALCPGGHGAEAVPYICSTPRRPLRRRGKLVTSRRRDVAGK